MYVLHRAYNVILIAKREQNMKDSMAYLVMPETGQGTQRTSGKAHLSSSVFEWSSLGSVKFLSRLPLVLAKIS